MEKKQIWSKSLATAILFEYYFGLLLIKKITTKEQSLFGIIFMRCINSRSKKVLMSHNDMTIAIGKNSIKKTIDSLVARKMLARQSTIKKNGEKGTNRYWLILPASIDIKWEKLK